jgi:transcriptional regulator with XRE-family HTH domain
MQTSQPLSPFMPVSRQRIAQDLDAISERAQRIHLSLHHLARRAGVPPSMLSQWRHGAAAATGQTFSHHLNRIARALEEEEAQLRKYLCGKRVHDGDRAKASRARATASRGRGVPARAAV